MSRFKPVRRDMDYLFPPSMNDWLPGHHRARFIVEIVEQLDLKPMERAYGTSGSAPFHPALLLSILVYGYATGVFSSRKLENATYDSVAFRFVAADEHPDHDTLNTFRKRFLKEIETLNSASADDRPHPGRAPSGQHCTGRQQDQSQRIQIQRIELWTYQETGRTTDRRSQEAHGAG